MTVLSFPVFLMVLRGGGCIVVRVWEQPRDLGHTAVVHSFCEPCVGALSKRTKVFGRVAKHRGETVGSSVVEMVQKQIAVTHALVQLGTFVYPVDEGPIREHLEHPVPELNICGSVHHA